MNTKELEQSDHSLNKGGADGNDAGEPVSTHSSSFNLGKCILWTFIGLPLCLWAWARDGYDFWRIIYFDPKKIVEDNEKTKLSIFITEKLMIDLQIIIKTAEEKELKPSDFYTRLHHIDPVLYRLAEDDERADPGSVNNHHIQYVLTDYIGQFGEHLNASEQVVDIPQMRKILPKGQVYNKEYLTVAQHINVPWIKKGMRKYK